MYNKDYSDVNLGYIFWQIYIRNGRKREIIQLEIRFEFLYIYVEFDVLLNCLSVNFVKYDLIFV